MTDQNYTDITILLDKSSSMATIRQPTLEGINSFIKAQKEVPGLAKLSLVQFSTNEITYETSFSGMDLDGIEPLALEDFKPRGTTALLDSIARCMRETGERLFQMAEENRPGKVIFVIVTDGIENASRIYNYRQVREMILHQEEKYSWRLSFSARMLMLKQSKAVLV